MPYTFGGKLLGLGHLADIATVRTGVNPHRARSGAALTDFPDNSGITFAVHVYDENGQVTIPDWQGDQWMTNPNPQCDYATPFTNTRATVKY